jgi:hypothetical protein
LLYRVPHCVAAALSLRPPGHEGILAAAWEAVVREQPKYDRRRPHPAGRARSRACALAQAPPSVAPGGVLSYLFAGALVIVIMRMLGEMAVANPTVGSFVLAAAFVRQRTERERTRERSARPVRMPAGLGGAR